MIKVCMFDMGGVIVRDFQMAPELLPFLGRKELAFADMPSAIKHALHDHSMGLIDEEKFWTIYERETSSNVERNGQSLLGRFFHPVLDVPTMEVIKRLKRQNMRIICGTNVIDSHFRIHHTLKQYDIFDRVYASHLMHLAKPDRAFYRYILEKEKVSADEVFFTDDMEENIAAAKEEGLTAFHYTHAGNLITQLKICGIDGI